MSTFLFGAFGQPLIRPFEAPSPSREEGRSGGEAVQQLIFLLPLREKVDRGERETDEGSS